MKSLIGYRTISWIHLCICLYAYIFFQYSQNTENIAVFDNSFGYSLFLLFFPLEDFKIFCLFTKMSKFCVHMWIGFLKFIPLQEKKLKKKFIPLNIKYTFNQKTYSLLPLENSPFFIFNNFPLSSFTTLFFRTLLSEMLDLLGCWLLFYLFFHNFCPFTFLFLFANAVIFKYFSF